MTGDPPTPQTGLRILAADENEAALRDIAELLTQLGHEVTSFAVDVGRAGQHVADEDPDVSVVVVHRDADHALDLISEIASYASGPVIALLEHDDPEFVSAAAERGIAAVAHGGSADAVQSAIEVARRRHAEAAALTERVDKLEGALDRRAVIERAKGVLMERHAIDDHAAFELLRGHARSRGATVGATAQAVLDGHALLPARPGP